MSWAHWPARTGYTPEDEAAMMPETYVNPVANAVVRTPEYMARGVG
jgi:hypothetical protein